MRKSETPADAAARCAQVTLDGPNALADKEMLESLETLMRAANTMVQVPHQV
jgi:hypothetical protein